MSGQSHNNSMRQVIYVDAGWHEVKNGHVAWFNKTTGRRFYEKKECANNHTCELEAVLKALVDHMDSIEKDEIEILLDSDSVVKQLNGENAINRDDIRELAMKIWKISEGRKVRFLWIPREQNRAGKMLGS